MAYSVRVTVPARGEAKNVFSKWDAEDGYYSMMLQSAAGDINVKARRYPYIETSESNAVSMMVKSDVPVDGPVTLVYMDGRADAGLPHTRGLTGIALPVFLLWEPSEKTMRHELVHLSQKQYPAKWWAWYERVWKFRKANQDEFLAIPERWRKRRRINPDTLGSPYTVWLNRYIPLSVFLNDVDPDLRYCKRGFWDLKMSQWTWEPPPGWDDLFGTGFNDEHPNEIAAHWIDGSAGEEKRKIFDRMPI
jgi:hypothetical protein